MGILGGAANRIPAWTRNVAGALFVDDLSRRAKDNPSVLLWIQRNNKFAPPVAPEAIYVGVEKVHHYRARSLGCFFHIAVRIDACKCIRCPNSPGSEISEFRIDLADIASSLFRLLKHCIG